MRWFSIIIARETYVNIVSNEQVFYPTLRLSLMSKRQLFSVYRLLLLSSLTLVFFKYTMWPERVYYWRGFLHLMGLSPSAFVKSQRKGIFYSTPKSASTIFALVMADSCKDVFLR